MVIIGQFTVPASIDLSYCDGDWTDPPYTKWLRHDSNDSSGQEDLNAMVQQYGNYKIYASRTAFDRHHSTQTVEKFVQEACPAQQAGYTCYYGEHNQDKSKLLEARRFLPHNPMTCQPFTVSKFLKLISNRKILILGDSISGQVWESLVCTLYEISGVTTHLYTHFNQHFKNFNNPLLVPVPIDTKKIGVENPLHAHIVSGYMTLKELNSTISFVSEPLDMTNYIPRMIKKYQLHKQDILIFNMGMHVNQEQQQTFAEVLLPAKRKEIEEVLGVKCVNNQECSSIPNKNDAPMIFISETTPQHFSTDNGYYTNDAKIKSYGCSPHNFTLTNDDRLVRSDDWRNALVYKTMDPLAKQGLVSYIPIGKYLHSQYDAHAGGAHDCTHWCFPSGIHKYFHLIYFNAFIKRLQEEGSIRDPPLTGSSQYAMEDNDDITWKLHPTLRNHDIVCFYSQTQFTYDCYRIEKGKFRRYYNLNALKQLENIHLVSEKTSLQQAIKTYPNVKFIEIPLEVGDYILGEPLGMTSKHTSTAKAASANSVTAKHFTMKQTDQKTTHHTRENNKHGIGRNNMKKSQNLNNL